MKPDNRKVPESEVTLWDGSKKSLHDYWKDSKLVMVFLRHLG